jgi:hypothetical protein
MIDHDRFRMTQHVVDVEIDRRRLAQNVTFASRTLGKPAGSVGTTPASSDSVVSAELRITMSAGCWSIRTTPCVSSTKPPGVVRSRCIALRLLQFGRAGGIERALQRGRVERLADQHEAARARSPSCQRRSK